MADVDTKPVEEVPPQEEPKKEEPKVEAKSEMKQRSSSSSAAKKGEKKRTQSEAKEATVQAVVDAMAEKAPAWLGPHLKKAGPIIVQVGVLVDKSQPYIALAGEKYGQLRKVLAPYHPEEMAPMFFGLVLMFFGGSFLTTIACVEAIRLCGYGQVLSAFKKLHENYKIAKKASEEDDQVDADGDGVADVLQIDSKELLSRKLMLVLKSVDPNEVQAALAGLYSSFVAVLAVLQTKFARVVALGATIGEFLAKPVNKYGKKYIYPMVPEEYHKWIPFVVGYLCRSIGVSIAWMLQRVISAFHSAIRGAEIFIDGFAVYAERMGYGNLAEGYIDDIAAWAMAFFGFYFQLMSGFSLPWFLYIPMFPLVIVEWLLAMIIGLA